MSSFLRIGIVIPDVKTYRVSQKTWEFSDELDMNCYKLPLYVIPNFKSHNIIMSASKVYFMKRVDVSKEGGSPEFLK